MLEAIQQFLALNPLQITLGLERIKKALSLCGNPQLRYKVIHIAGTNGKGSTASFIECGIIHSEYKVGKFTSPHLHKINETICLNGTPISDTDLAHQYEVLQQMLITNNLNLSFFEMLCLIMFNYFAEQNIEYLVLECGMGGTDDSTNVVNAEVHIITNIALEHTKWLGNTLKQIAEAKTGIIHNGYTILGCNTPELIYATKMHTTNYVCVTDLAYSTTQDGFNSIVLVDQEYYHLHLAGKFQIMNFLCAYSALKHLNIRSNSIRYTAENTKWTGRLEIIEQNPTVIIDAMHNTHGAIALVHSLCDYCKAKDVVIICSILKDKDVSTILETLSNIGKNLILTNITNTPRATAMNQLNAIAQKLGKFDNIQTIEEPKMALITAKLQNPKMILICGSTYLLNYFIEATNV